VPKALRSLGSRWAASPGSKKPNYFLFSNLYLFSPSFIFSSQLQFGRIVVFLKK
jgi:hypothetical protein